MKPIVAALILSLLSSAALGQSSQTGHNIASGDPVATIDRGKFLVYTTSTGGKQIGTETFHIGSNGSGESSDELTLGGQTGKFSSVITLDAVTKHPTRVELQQEPGVKLIYDFAGSQVNVSGGKEATGQTDPEAVILENNFWYQYFFFTERYDDNKGGEQQFKAFVPSLMQTFAVSMRAKGAIGPFAGSSSKLNWYEITGPGGLKIETLTETSGHLVYVGVPSQGAYAVREEYAASVTQIRSALSPKAADSQKIDYRAPPAATFVSEEVKVSLKDFDLAGTLLVPKDCGGPCPAVIMITGSGQQTRDEPLPLSGLEKYRPFRQIAETLASHGIAVLRVDDRGIGGSTGAATLADATTSSFADDTRAQVAYLRTRKEIDPDRIALVGHSEGGEIAPMVAASDPRIRAIVAMAGPGKQGSEISLYQVQQALEATGLGEEAKKEKLAEQRTLIEDVRLGHDLSKYPPQARSPWIKEWFTYDPIATIKRVRQPILILQGSVDQQITADQAGLLEQAARAAGNDDVTVRVFEGLNHLFLPARTGAVSEYASLQTNEVPREVLDALTTWLESKLHAK